MASLSDEILQTLVPLVVQLLGLDLELFHGDEILNEGFSERAADDVVLLQRLQSIVHLYGDGEVFLLAGSFGQGALDGQVPPDSVQPGGHGGGQHDVGVGHGGPQLVVDVRLPPAVALDVKGAAVVVAAAGGVEEAFGVLDRLGHVVPAAEARRHQAAQGGRVGQEPRQPLSANLRQLAGLLAAVEEAPSAVGVPQAVGEHAGVVEAVIGEEAGYVAVFASHFLDACAEGERAVGGRNPKLWPQVDLHLAGAAGGRYAVNVGTHAVHAVHQLLKEGQVMVAEKGGGGEEERLRPDPLRRSQDAAFVREGRVQGESQALELAEELLGDEARRRPEGTSCHGARVTDDPRRLLGPGQELEGGEVRDQEDIAAEVGGAGVVHLVALGAQRQLQVAPWHGYAVNRLLLQMKAESRRVMTVPQTSPKNPAEFLRGSGGQARSWTSTRRGGPWPLSGQS